MRRLSPESQTDVRPLPGQQSEVAMPQALTRNARRTQRGQAVVEFALVLPVLLLLLVGIIFFARAFQLQQVLSSAVREGARVWAANPTGGAWYQCGDLPCPNNPSPGDTNFYRFVMPVVRDYVKDSGFSDAEVIFFTTQKAQEADTIKSIVSGLDADNEKVTLTIFYKYSLPLGSLGELTPIYLRASCTIKRG